MDGQTGGQMDRETGNWMDRQVDRWWMDRDRQMNRLMDGEASGQTGRHKVHLWGLCSGLADLALTV